SGVVASLDRALDGGLTRHLEREEFKGNKDQFVELATLGRFGDGAAKIVLFGLGPADQMSEADWRTAGARVGRAAIAGKIGKLGVVLPEALGATKLRALAEGLVLGSYRFLKYFTGDRRPTTTLAEVEIFAPRGRGAAGKAAPDAIAIGQRVGEAVCIAR